MSSRILAIGAVATTAVLGYCIYFDYNRRNSPEFRRKLKKEAKKYKKLQIEKEETDKKLKFISLKDKLTASLESDPLPTGLEKQQEFFLEQIALAEQLAASPDSAEDAAVLFYKALAVYPSPAELLIILQKTVSESIYELVVFLISVQPPLSLSSLLGEEFGAVDGDIKIGNPE